MEQRIHKFVNKIKFACEKILKRYYIYANIVDYK
jgi:hypothetical protein